MLTTVAFVMAIALLVVVHEWGHYAMAVACGVKVLTFSVGFGPRLAGWKSKRSGTEFVVSALPLGGFVKMLDEREAPVAPEHRHMAFNTQPLGRRAAIVAAGPMANFVLAVALYTVVNWIGFEQPQAVLARPATGSMLAKAGMDGGERVVAAALDGDELQPVVSFDDFRWWLTRAALERRDIRLQYTDAKGATGPVLRLPLGDMPDSMAESQLFQQIGVGSPLSVAQLGELTQGGAAQLAGLRKGDVVVAVDQTVVIDAPQLRQLIRSAVRAGDVESQHWKVQREGVLHSFTVTPQRVVENGATIGRVGAYIGAPPPMVLVRYGVLVGVERAVQRTWDVSMLTLRMIVQMLTGEASFRNLSGPITIADYAGKSAAMGVTTYLVFVALISVSLGVLNLLPLPVLDGGHLMYYLWEWVRGKPLSEPWMERIQRLGIAVLLMMMSVAVFNDVTRLVG